MRSNKIITKKKMPEDLLFNSLNYSLNSSQRKCIEISLENLYVDIGA